MRSLLNTVFGLLIGMEMHNVFIGIRDLSADTVFAWIAGALLPPEVPGNKNSAVHFLMRSMAAKIRNGKLYVTDGRCGCPITGLGPGTALAAAVSAPDAAGRYL